MQKVIVFLKHPLSFPISILAVIYIYWLFTAPMSLFFDDNFSNYFAGLILLGVYILIVSFAIIASVNWKFTILFVIFTLPIIFGTTLYTVWQFSSELPLTGSPRSKIFFLTVSLLAITYPLITILSRPTDNKKTSLILFLTMIPILEASISYPLNFYPRTLDSAKLGKYNYYVVSSPDWDNHYFQTFYKCKQFGFSCKYLYSSYSKSTGQLVVDKQEKEVSLLGFIGLLYTEGENPRYYSQPAVEFEDHVYQFWDVCNKLNSERDYYICDSYTYILHECNLDYLFCKTLPIQYTTQGLDGMLRIIGNEETKEINVYNDYPEDSGFLIFTYGEHPRCYVEGCEILEEAK